MKFSGESFDVNEIIKKSNKKEELNSSDNEVLKLREKGLEKIPGEIEKSSGDEEMIEMCHQFLLHIMEKMNIEYYNDFDINRVHLVRDMGLGSEDGNIGEYNTMNHSIKILLPKDSMELKDGAGFNIVNIVHELIHFYQKRKIIDIQDFGLVSMGLSLRKINNSRFPSRINRGRGIMEFFTSFIARDIVLDNQDLLVSKYGEAVRGDLVEENTYLRNYNGVFDNILVGVGRDDRDLNGERGFYKTFDTEGVDRSEIVDDIKSKIHGGEIFENFKEDIFKGVFGGQIPEDVIEKIKYLYGGKSMWVLSVLGGLSDSEEFLSVRGVSGNKLTTSYNKKIASLGERFFDINTGDLERREIIGGMGRVMRTFDETR